jgi:hypothetical protein
LRSSLVSASRVCLIQNCRTVTYDRSQHVFGNTLELNMNAHSCRLTGKCLSRAITNLHTCPIAVLPNRAKQKKCRSDLWRCKYSEVQTKACAWIEKIEKVIETVSQCWVCGYLDTRSCLSIVPGRDYFDAMDGCSGRITHVTSTTPAIFGSALSRA